jgi:acetolactate synthase-1/2/3 large subunit
MPAALGAKLAEPGATVMAVVGDGGFAVSMSTLMTAVQEGIPLVVLVLNNAALGWVAHGMGDKAVASHFMDFDHAGIARSMGCEGVRPGNVGELRAALRRARETTAPLVIDARTNLETSFRDIVQPISGGRWKAGE